MTRIMYHPMLPLSIFALSMSAIFSFYLIAGLAPSEPIEVVASFYSAFLLIYWMVADARRRQEIPCFDFGFLCYMFFPLTLVWYCFWSRGWRGMLTLFLLLALFLAPYLVSTLLWIGLYG